MIRAQEMMYKAVVQIVMLYGSEIWVITDAMMKVLEGFCHQIDSMVVRKTTRRVGEEVW